MDSETVFSKNLVLRLKRIFSLQIKCQIGHNNELMTPND